MKKPHYADDAERQDAPRFSPAKRLQAKRRKQVLTMQMEMQLSKGPFRILDARSYKRADRLAIKHQYGELRQFLIHRAQKLREVSPDSAEKEVRDWLHFFRYEGRGRPRGTGHPKVTVEDLLARIGISLIDVNKLRKAGLTERDIKILYAVVRSKSQVAAAKELDITPQAVSKHLKRKILPRLKQLNPHFSVNRLRSAIAESAPE